MMEQNTIGTTSGAEESRRSTTLHDLTRSIMPVPVERVEGPVSRRKQDVVAIEEPLQIRLNYGLESDRVERDVAITMRTPGHDVDLATGFLFSEGILESVDQILRIRHTDRAYSGDGNRNSVTIDLLPGVDFDFQRLDRNFFVSSSCGVCGKVSVEAVRSRICFPLPSETPLIEISAIPRLPETLRE